MKMKNHFRNFVESITLFFKERYRKARHLHGDKPGAVARRHKVPGTRRATVLDLLREVC
jgi:hypothetical protein